MIVVIIANSLYFNQFLCIYGEDHTEKWESRRSRIESQKQLLLAFVSLLATIFMILLKHCVVFEKVFQATRIVVGIQGALCVKI